MEEKGTFHLDHWEHLEDLSKDPIGQQNFTWGSPKSKNVEYKVEHPVFSKDKNGKPIISYIDQFPSQKYGSRSFSSKTGCLRGSENKISHC